MKFTKIEWCDSSANPTENCDGCELWNKKKHSCYAGRMTERIRGKGAFDKPVILHPGRMLEYARFSDLTGHARKDKPWIPKEYPRIIFVGDMADVFSRAVPFDYLKTEVIDNVTSAFGQRHIWMILTKQAKRLSQFDQWLATRRIAWPQNLWPGVSVTKTDTLWRVSYLQSVRAERRFISYEPAWEYVDFAPVLQAGKIHQIIGGGESGSKEHPFNADWARQLIKVCTRFDVSCFIKQMGMACVSSVDDFHCPMSDIGKTEVQWLAHFKHKKGGDWNEWPESLRVRQFPELPVPW